MQKLTQTILACAVFALALGISTFVAADAAAAAQLEEYMETSEGAACYRCRAPFTKEVHCCDSYADPDDDCCCNPFEEPCHMVGNTGCSVFGDQCLATGQACTPYIRLDKPCGAT